MTYLDMAISGTIIGYDPGGNGCHGLAKLVLASGEIQEATTDTLQTAEQVIRLILGETSLVGLGVDTLTCWSTGASGWRPADRWLRNKYKKIKNSIVSPNGLFGSMGLNGMAVIMSLRTKLPNLFITETHPKVLYWFLTHERHDYDNKKALMDTTLMTNLGTKISPANDHEWDGAISAFAALQGLKDAWKHDLHKIPVAAGERLVNPCGPTHYFWPE